MDENGNYVCENVEFDPLYYNPDNPMDLVIRFRFFLHEYVTFVFIKRNV